MSSAMKRVRLRSMGGRFCFGRREFLELFSSNVDEYVVYGLFWGIVRLERGGGTVAIERVYNRVEHRLL